MALVQTSNHTTTTTTYDRDMQDKISDFMAGSKYENTDDGDDEATLESARRELDIPTSLEDNTLDHIVLACSDIKTGMQDFEEMTGLKPGIVTTKRGGAGVKSSLINLSDNVFIEIIAPIPGTSEGMSADLQGIAPGKLVAYHYAVRTDDPEKFEENPPASWEVDKVTMIGAGNPDRFDEDGGIFKWDVVHMYGHGLGGVVPSYVHWRENKSHPTAHLEQQGGRLSNVQVYAPSSSHVHSLLNGVQNVDVNAGEPELIFDIDTPRGSVSFSGKNPTGIVMPGFNDWGHQSYNKGAP
jgi:hypothetical protein